MDVRRRVPANAGHSLFFDSATPPSHPRNALVSAGDFFVSCILSAGKIAGGDKITWAHLIQSIFSKQVEEQRSQDRALAWEGTFAEYLEIVAKQPHVADLAHARLFNMIVAAGRGRTRRDR